MKMFLSGKDNYLSNLSISKLVDFLFDPRLPHWFWLTYYKKFIFRRLVNKTEYKGSLNLVLTFDVEQDFGSLGKTGITRTSIPFLKEFSEISAQKGWICTYFVQGDLIESLSGELQVIQKNHELGMHGFHHELWGHPLWYSPEKAGTHVSERETLLRKGLEAFEKCGLDRPKSFRAPNLIIDRFTLKLLEKYKFEIDSSAPSYRGILPLPKPLGRVISLPVTADLIPDFKYRGIFPTFAPYKVMNLRNFLLLSDKDLLNLIKRVANFQLLNCLDPFIILFAHPWEFLIEGNKSQNFSSFIKRIELIENNFEIRFQRLRDLVKVEKLI